MVEIHSVLQSTYRTIMYKKQRAGTLMNMNIHDLMVMNNSLKHSSQQMTECKLKREYNLFNRKKPNYMYQSTMGLLQYHKCETKYSK